MKPKQAKARVTQRAKRLQDRLQEYEKGLQAVEGRLREYEERTPEIKRKVRRMRQHLRVLNDEINQSGDWDSLRRELVSQLWWGISGIEEDLRNDDRNVNVTLKKWRSTGIADEADKNDDDRYAQGGDESRRTTPLR